MSRKKSPSEYMKLNEIPKHVLYRIHLNIFYAISTIIWWETGITGKDDIKKVFDIIDVILSFAPRDKETFEFSNKINEFKEKIDNTKEKDLKIQEIKNLKDYIYKNFYDAVFSKFITVGYFIDLLDDIKKNIS